MPSGRVTRVYKFDRLIQEGNLSNSIYQEFAYFMFCNHGLLLMLSLNAPPPTIIFFEIGIFFNLLRRYILLPFSTKPTRTLLSKRLMNTFWIYLFIYLF
jgi:hypothetical protein